MKVTRLPVTGDVREAVISPDGKYVAYVANDPTGRASSSGRSRPTATSSSSSRPPSDRLRRARLLARRQHLYYVAFKDGGSEPALFSVPVFGGASKKVLDGLHGPITFSPDGRRIALWHARPRAGERRSTLVVADPTARTRAPGRHAAGNLRPARVVARRADRSPASTARRRVGARVRRLTTGELSDGGSGAY